VGLPVVILDGLGDLIKVPLLSSNIHSPSLEPDIVGTVALSYSLHWHSGSNVERSIDMESELLVEALSSNSFSLVNIDNLPSLVGVLFVISISTVDNYLLAFIIL
jgi:hypothetical protein